MISRWIVLLTALGGAGACSGGGGGPADGAADLPYPDTPLVKLDQRPLQGAEAGSAGQDHGAVDVQRPVVRTAPFFLDFEQGSGQLVGTRDWEWGRIVFVGAGCDSGGASAPTAGHSGNGLWGTKLNDCYTNLDNAAEACSNQSLANDSVLSVKVNLPSTLPNPRLTYWEWGDYFLPWDWSEVRVDGKVVQQVCKSDDLPSAPQWEKRSVDLKAHVGSTVEITFHFMASDVVNYAGWYIDDLSVNSD